MKLYILVAFAVCILLSGCSSTLGYKDCGETLNGHKLSCTDESHMGAYYNYISGDDEDYGPPR